MNLAELLDKLSSHHAELRTHGVASLHVFGSVARDEASPDSDVDLLVEFEKPVGLLAFVRLRRRLQDLLGCTVDLVTPNGLRPEMRAHVLKEAIRAA